MKLYAEKLQSQNTLLLGLTLVAMVITLCAGCSRHTYRKWADIYDPDCEPLPPDDPAANCYMRKPHPATFYCIWVFGIRDADQRIPKRKLQLGAFGIERSVEPQIV